MVDKQVDILIIGGGLTGASLLLALAEQGFSSLLVDANPLSAKTAPDFDARSLALAPASIRILEMLKLWPLLKPSATAIEAIHVSEQGRFAITRIRAQADMPLGYVVEMQAINQALAQLIDKKQLLAPAQLISLEQGIALFKTPEAEIRVAAKLIVAADGSESAVRSLTGLKSKDKEYGQQAIVANIALARAHRGEAYERFTPAGPLALLPMTQGRASLVWALEPARANVLMAAEDHAFLQALQQAFGYRLGRFVRVGQRRLYPLAQRLMNKSTSWPFVFVGNAAHTLHPVAGQGFNLGLRDVAALAQCIIEKGLNEAMLQDYQAMRHHDQRAIIALTNGLIEVFTSRIPGMGFLRNLGLLAVDNLPFLKKTLVHYTRGFGGICPDLVCGLALDKEELR